MFDKNTTFLGIAPIGWCNDDMPELGAENTFRQTVSEMALAGFTGCEIGNKYPKDPAVLKQQLDLRGLRVASAWFSSFLITEPLEKNEASFMEAVRFLKAAGADRINVSEQSYSIQGCRNVPILDDKKHIMTDKEWSDLASGLDRLGRIAADEGFRLCFHHHMGTVVQTAGETERLMQMTNPDLVWLCYDTGHFTFAGEDPLYILRRYADRIGHVHLKDIRLDIRDAASAGHLSFLDAILRGVFTVPGDGDTDFEEVFRVLDETSYKGWLLVEAEQDPDKADPLAYAIKARSYLRSTTGL